MTAAMDVIERRLTDGRVVLLDGATGVLRPAGRTARPKVTPATAAAM